LAGVAWLTRKQRGITQVELATHAHTDVMMTSQVVRTLEQRKVLKRTPHTSDRRAWCLELTRNGRQLVLQALPLVEAVDQVFFASLHGQQRAFVKGLQRLLNKSTPRSTVEG
jgi:DNA-binding MarR family transcriptional regulator